MNTVQQIANDTITELTDRELQLILVRRAAARTKLNIGIMETAVENLENKLVSARLLLKTLRAKHTAQTQEVMRQELIIEKLDAEQP